MRWNFKKLIKTENREAKRLNIFQNIITLRVRRQTLLPLHDEVTDDVDWCRISRDRLDVSDRFDHFLERSSRPFICTRRACLVRYLERFCCRGRDDRTDGWTVRSYILIQAYSSVHWFHAQNDARPTTITGHLRISEFTNETAVRYCKSTAEGREKKGE